MRERWGEQDRHKLGETETEKSDTQPQRERKTESTHQTEGAKPPGEGVGAVSEPGVAVGESRS